MIGPYGDFQFTSWSRDRVSTLARTWENPGKKEAQQDLPAHPPVPAWLSHSLTYSSSQEKVKVTQLCPTLHDPMDLATRLFCPRNSPGQNTGVDSRFLLQGIFLTKGSNPSLLHCRWILYHLSHQESPDKQNRGIFAHGVLPLNISISENILSTLPNWYLKFSMNSILALGLNHWSCLHSWGWDPRS